MSIISGRVPVGGKLQGRKRLYQATSSIHYDELPVPATSTDELDILYFRRFFESFYQIRIEDMNVDLNKLLENIKLGVHSERNQLIVSYLTKIGYMTQIETGVPRMSRLLKRHTGREPDFEARDHQFTVRIWRPAL